MNQFNKKSIFLLFTLLSMILIFNNAHSEETIYFEAKLNGEKCSLKFPIKARRAKSTLHYTYGDLNPDNHTEACEYTLEVKPLSKGSPSKILEKIKTELISKLDYYHPQELVNCTDGIYNNFPYIDLITTDHSYYYQTRYIPISSKVLSFSARFDYDNPIYPSAFNDKHISKVAQGLLSSNIRKNSSYVKGTIEKKIALLPLVDHKEHHLQYCVYKDEVFHSVEIRNFDKNKTASEVLENWLGSVSEPFDPLFYTKPHIWNGYEALDVRTLSGWMGGNCSLNYYRAIVTDNHLYIISASTKGDKKTKHKKTFKAFKIHKKKGTF